MEEHELMDRLAATKLAIQYLNAQRGGSAAWASGAAPQPTFQVAYFRHVKRETSWEPGNLCTAQNQWGPWIIIAVYVRGGSQGPENKESFIEILPDLDNSVFDGGIKSPRKFCHQQRFEKQLNSLKLDF